LKVEGFEVWCGAKRGDKGVKRFYSIVGIVEFFNPVEKVPELRKTTKVTVINVDCE